MISRLTAMASRMWQRCLPMVAMLWFWSLCGLAWAKKSTDEGPAKPEKGYVLAYAILILPLALGLMLVCRQGKREDKARRKIGELDADELEAKAGTKK